MYQLGRVSRSEIIDQLKVMRSQEESSQYRCRKYIEDGDDEIDYDKSDKELSRPIDAECRSKMVQWCYQIVAFASFHPETVSTAMSYLDRFLSSDHPKSRRVIANRKEYQLSCIAALYLAIKMNEREEIDPKNFSELARGTHLECEIIQMEATILRVLDWRMNGPTSFTFLHHLLELGPARMKSNTVQWSKITDLASYQIQLAMGDSFFVPYQPSLLALASILNSLEPTHKNILPSDIMNYIQTLIDVTDISPLAHALWEVKNRLWAIVKSSRLLKSLDLTVEESAPNQNFQTLTASRYPSPICVSRSNKTVVSSPSIQMKRKMGFE